MILFPNTRPVLSVERAVAGGFTIDQEGKALVSAMVGGIFGVKKSAGIAGEVFLGIAFNMLKPVTEMPYLESLTQGASNTVTLSYTPLAGTLRITDVNTGTQQTAAVSAANAYQIAGNVVSLFAAQTGHVYLISYRFAPTAAQVIALVGNVHPGGAAGDYLGQVGVIQKGDVFTTEYDASVDWSTGPAVSLGANGVFTVGGAGVVLTNVSVIAAPQAGIGALGLEIR